MEPTAGKQHAHELIDRHDPSMITTVVRFLEFVAMDPVARSIATAPVDEEPLTEEEDQALDRAEAWLKQNDGKGIPHEEILAEFGLSMKDFPGGGTQGTVCLFTSSSKNRIPGGSYDAAAAEIW